MCFDFLKMVDEICKKILPTIVDNYFSPTIVENYFHLPLLASTTINVLQIEALANHLDWSWSQEPN